VLGALGRRDDIRLSVLTTTTGSATVSQLAAAALDSLIVPPRADQISLALWGRYRSGAAFARAGAEVIVGAKHLIPRTTRPTVLVVHDLLTIARARENALAKRILLPAQYRRSLTDATRLVAVSAATRARLGEIDGSWEAKCSVVPNGMSARLIDAEPEPPAAVGSQPFALVVGDLSPRKNLALLTRLWETAPPEDLTLVVVGPDSGTDAPVRRELLALERAGRVVWIRGADDPVLRWCYEHARVVLFPTFEEGFGLPLLEAMTFHAPVVASTDLALLEVSAGDPLVTHVDPCDDGAWRTAITNALVAGRAPHPPQLPNGASTWREHTDRLISIARELARGIPSPRTPS
jgi:Glycosyltransferase